MIFRINRKSTEADASQVVRLDKQDFRIRTTWYAVLERWLCSVYTHPANVPVVEGVVMRSGQRILRWAKNGPAGELITIDLDEGRQDVTRQSLGQSLQLLYVDAATVEALRTDPVIEPVAASVDLVV